MTNDVHFKPEKCVFPTKKIYDLGFKITDKGLFKFDEKIKAIQESQAPTNVSEVRSFLGLITFNSKFYAEFSYHCSVHIPTDA